MKLLPLLLSLMFITACSVTPKPIDYGKDTCQFCQMTIVDRQHAAEIVTVKGKAYKYDAIECMMNDLSKWNRPEPFIYLVSDYAKPGELIDATNASFIITEEIPSPMGEYLSAFTVFDKKYTGEEMDWKRLNERFKKQ